MTMAEPTTIYKLIVLYMTENAGAELTNSQISEFVLDHNYTDYFQLQEILADLTETGLLSKKTISNKSYYGITEEGKKVLPYFEKDLSEEIQNEIREYLKNTGYEVPEAFTCPTDYYETSNGRFAVRCQIFEKGSVVLDLSMMAPGEEAAREICERWPSRCHDIYATIMGELV